LPRHFELLNHAELLRALMNLKGPPRRAADPDDASQLLHDLELHQLELEVQNLELRHAQMALEESRSRYMDLYDFAPVACCTLDADGLVIEANLAAASLFRLQSSAFLGRPLASMVVLADRRAVREQIHACCSDSRASTIEIRLSIRQLAPITVQLFTAPILDPGYKFHGCRAALVDITARKRGEEKVRFLAAASRILASSFDYENNLADVVRAAVPLLGDLCFVHLRERGCRLRCLDVAFADACTETFRRAHRRLDVPADRSPQAQVLHTGQPILVEHGLSAPAGYVARSTMFVPLSVRGEALGVFTFIAATDHRYDQKDLELVQDLAARAAMAIDNAQLYQLAQQATRAREELLQTVSHDLSNPLDTVAQVLSGLTRTADQGSRLAEQLATASLAAERMKRLTADLHDLTSIPATEIALDRTGHKVLIVDDERDAREALRDILEGHGYSVAEAEHGRAALDLLRCTVSPPTMILLDLFMPVMSGGELMLELKKDAALARVPVILVSTARDLAREVTRLGAAGYVAKPIRIPHLLATMSASRPTATAPS